MTHPPLEVWDTWLPLPASVSVELFIQPRNETLRDFLLLFGGGFCLGFLLLVGVFLSFFFSFFTLYLNEGNFIWNLFCVVSGAKKYSHRHS